MIIIDEASPELLELNQRQKELGRKIVDLIEPKEIGKTILTHSVLYQSEPERENIYWVREGNLQYVVRERLLFHYDPGDFVGLERIFVAPVPKIQTDFAVVVDVYSRQSFEDQLAKSEEFRKLVFEYLSLWAGLRDVVLSEHIKDVVGESLPMVKPYQPGETIIVQGENGGEVFNLLEGSADVVVDGVPVGEISPDEIFGALAAFAKVPRTATVTARTSCMVLTLPEDQFKALIERKPQTVLKLIEDMAHTIMRLNGRVVAGTKDKIGPKLYR